MSSRATGVTSLRKNGNCGTNYRRILIRTGLCKKLTEFHCIDGIFNLTYGPHFGGVFATIIKTWRKEGHQGNS